MTSVDILILGAGPTGLGAATQIEHLRNHGRTTPSYLLADAQLVPGGWAASATTKEHFTFDFGGHVLYPHRQYVRFTEVLAGLGLDWHLSIPKRGVLINGRLIPYPVQRNIQRLPTIDAIKCFGGLLGVRLKSALHPWRSQTDHCSLRDHLEKNFGPRLADLVLRPLNEKMWACPVERLDSSWARHRSGSSTPNVAGVSLVRLMRNLVCRSDDPGWAPDTRVPYPRFGGTGAIWSRVASNLPRECLLMGKQLVVIDSKSRVAQFLDGSCVAYKTLLSSIPLNILLKSIRDRPGVTSLAERLVWSSTRLWGLGLKGGMPAWLNGVHSFHLPDPTVPFWRVTFPAAFSPGNVPPGDGHWSILCESSEPRETNEVRDERFTAIRIEETLVRLGILPKDARVLSRWNASIDHGYPTPFFGRDVLLAQIQNGLQSLGVYSRGRFGGWRYEVSNQDDSFMQGVEVVNKVVLGIPETIYTFTEDKFLDNHLADSKNAY